MTLIGPTGKQIPDHSLELADLPYGSAEDQYFVTNASNEFILVTIPQVSGAEKTAGTETAKRMFSPADVKGMIDTHAGAGAGASLKRAEAVMASDSSTVNFTNDVEGNAVSIGDIRKCFFFIDATFQGYSMFTKTDANTVEATFGNISAGSVVTLIQID